MAHDNAAAAELIEPVSESGVQLRGATHPLLAAIERAPLAAISDEENAILDEIVRTTDAWMTDEEFVASVGLGSTP